MNGVEYAIHVMRDRARRQFTSTFCVGLCWSRLASVRKHILSCGVSSIRDGPDSKRIRQWTHLYVQDQQATVCVVRSPTNCEWKAAKTGAVVDNEIYFNCTVMSLWCRAELKVEALSFRMRIAQLMVYLFMEIGDVKPGENGPA